MNAYLNTAIEQALQAEFGYAADSTSTPSRQAPAPRPAPPSPAVTPQSAAANAIVVRDRLKAQAKNAASTPMRVDTGSRFYKRLTTFYLKDYLAAPSAAKGITACKSLIGKPFAGPATPGDEWEGPALTQWNVQQIPSAAKRLLGTNLPSTLEAATDILSRPNRKELPFVDVPFLIGEANFGTGFDADVAHGGKNISHLMHWGTGAKYAEVPALEMRQLFLAYELWHLEAWDVFGEDPINDMIVEEAGRILGTKLRAGTLTNGNLRTVLDGAFGEARAWVGTLLRARLTELDAWAIAKTQKKAQIWWGAGTPPEMDIWGSETLYSMLLSGKSVNDVANSKLAQRIQGIYGVIFWADAWEKANGAINNGTLIPKFLAGQYNSKFEKIAKGQPIFSLGLAAAGLAGAMYEPPEEDATPYASELQQAAGPPPSSGLTWSGATPEQLAFKRRVYDQHVARSSRGRTFVANVPAAELGAITLPGGGAGGQLRTAAAASLTRLLAAAAAAFTDAQARGDAKARAGRQIGVASAYRSVSSQFSIWNTNFTQYYEQTRDRRTAAPGGEHGEQAAAIQLGLVGSKVGAPGYSLHNNGLAVDLSSAQGGTNLGPSSAGIRLWRQSWAWDWLSANAARFDFFQNTSIDEPWHWEYRPPGGGTTATPAPVTSSELGWPAGALGGLPAGEAAVTSVPLLAAHHDRGPDLFLRWNAIADPAAGIDVVVHLHGFSSDRHLDLVRGKLPISGLDFAPPTLPTSIGGPPLPAFTGRSRPTLLVLPRGRAVPGSDAAYDFPALTASGGFASLVDVALRELERTLSIAAGTARPARIILTAHSGGGSPLDAILARTANTAVDPHEVQVFDALYGSTAGLRGWVDRRLRADIAGLQSGGAAALAQLPSIGGALRVLYLPATPGINPRTGKPYVSTEPGSAAVRQQLRTLIPAGQPYTAELQRRWAVEVAGVGHTLIPYWYGGRLLADPAATIARP